MKMIITRTSDYESKPCDEAFKMAVPRWQTRTCTEEYFNEKYSERSGLWRSKGKNHKEIKAQSPSIFHGKTKLHKNWITRQMDDVEVWGIEINTLDDLFELEEKHGSIIISSDINYEMKEIEIYDGWRE